jgi:hypothetical protein
MQRFTACFFASILLFAQLTAARASEIYDPDLMVILLVGVSANELAEHEKKILRGKKVIEIDKTNDWQKSIISNSPQEVVLRQNTGFVGLYTPNGSLVRGLDLIDSPNPYFVNQPIPAPVQDMVYQEVDKQGYNTGGRIDPYQPIAVYEPKNNGRLAAGWGYNSQLNQPNTYKRSAVVDFLNFAPIDAVTPFNYPGHYDQVGIPAAYGLGVLPHIGGLFAARKRAKAEQQNFEYYQRQGAPDYLEAPVQYYRYNQYQSKEPSNPITSDPNFIRLQQMPQSFNKVFPYYGQ